MEEPDYMKRWNRAKKQILQSDNLWEQLVKMSSRSLDDFETLRNRDPLTITEYFISRMIQQ